MNQQPRRNAYKIFIPSLHDGTRLEARVGVNYVDDQNFVKAVIISHPYGPLGGNFYNNVVVTVEQYFQDKGYLTIAFNFRGSGKSKGRTSWSGEPECEDYKTMLEFLSKSGKIGENTILQIPKVSDVTIIGYSYGSLIASSVASSSPQFTFPTSYILINYPLSVTWFLTFFRSSTYLNYLQTLLVSTSRVLFIYGDSDQFTGVGKYRQWVKINKAAENPLWTIKELKGTDHFYTWQSMEDKLIEALDEWIDNVLATR
ncbi:alpha/beta-hydrolase [Gigaspora margarita]|uniref:Alpha/beta-hydrolase n=1 Tax=Gigaspora margarita TaxID=4874 RepID=A0A8H3WUA8_GIGMA|nr:alpha/beta-hydrolase [Gigaspora margarita]